MPSKAVHQVVPQVVPQTRVVIVQDKTLPPVLQRIASAKATASPGPGTGRSLRGTRHRHVVEAHAGESPALRPVF
jgi:hypothetical protein